METEVWSFWGLIHPIDSEYAGRRVDVQNRRGRPERRVRSPFLFFPKSGERAFGGSFSDARPRIAARQGVSPV